MLAIRFSPPKLERCEIIPARTHVSLMFEHFCDQYTLATLPKQRACVDHLQKLRYGRHLPGDNGKDDRLDFEARVQTVCCGSERALLHYLLVNAAYPRQHHLESIWNPISAG